MMVVSRAEPLRQKNVHHISKILENFNQAQMTAVKNALIIIILRAIICPVIL